MRKIREILRLRAAGKSQHLIALSVGVGQSTVGIVSLVPDWPV